MKAVLDACVLYPTILREILQAAAEAGLYQPVFSDRILRENNEKMRQEFTANVSHELKTPLTSISGFAETLLDDDFKDLGFDDLDGGDFDDEDDF